MQRLLGWLIVLALLGIAAWFARDYIRKHPEDFPWTVLDLDHPIGAFTGRKLAALTGDPAQCRALLARSGSADITAPPLIRDANCRFDDGMRLVPASPQAIRFIPSGLVTSCPVAAALLLLERDVLQPAALKHFGVRVASIDHAGSYSCRRLYGRSTGPFSEQAKADAFDILGFRLISVVDDGPAAGPRQPSCATCATVHATCSRQFCRPIRMPRTPITSTSTRPSAAKLAGAAAASSLQRDSARRLPQRKRGPALPRVPSCHALAGEAYFR